MLYPASGFTKGDLIDYYARVAPLILPHLAGRAVTLKRYPDGVDGKAFFEKRCPAHRPDWLPTLRVPTGKGKPIDYCHLDDAAVPGVGGQPRGDRAARPARADGPARPADGAWCSTSTPARRRRPPTAVAVARRLQRHARRAEACVSLVKTSGGKGLHLLVPLNAAGVSVRRHQAVRPGRRADAGAGRPRPA